MLLKLLVQLTLFLIFQGGLFFVAAGTLNWPQGWAFIIEFGLLCVAISLWLLKTDPGLLAERMGGINQKDQAGADRIVMGAIMLFWFSWCIIMGLDARWHGSRLPLWLQVFGGMSLAAGFAVIAVVFRSNSFAAPVVKIQQDRGQHLIDTGPYALVRHPMYVGGMLVFLGIPLMLGSLWGLALIPVLIGAVVARMLVEEHTLVRDLAGYGDYMARVRWRLVPYLW